MSVSFLFKPSLAVVASTYQQYGPTYFLVSSLGSILSKTHEARSSQQIVRSLPWNRFQLRPTSSPASWSSSPAHAQHGLFSEDLSMVWMACDLKSLECDFYKYSFHHRNPQKYYSDGWDLCYQANHVANCVMTLELKICDSALCSFRSIYCAYGWGAMVYRGSQVCLLGPLLDRKLPFAPTW